MAFYHHFQDIVVQMLVVQLLVVQMLAQMLVQMLQFNFVLIFPVNLCVLSIPLSIPRRLYENVRCLFYTASPAWKRSMKK